MAWTWGKPPPWLGFGGSHHHPMCKILCVWPRGQHPNVILSWVSQVGVPKIPKLRLPQLWRPTTSCIDLQSKWGLKKSCRSRQDLFNGMWHATYKKINRGNSRLLVVGSQSAILTFSPSFGHNLCFKYPNGSWKFILDIYIPKKFRWYKELFNLIILAPAIALWRFWSPFGFQLLMWEFIWECGGSSPHTLLHSWEYEMWLLGFILGPHFCEPKARVAIEYVWKSDMKISCKELAYSSMWVALYIQYCIWHRVFIVTVATCPITLKAI
jgi:hypothetical protein